MDLSLASVDELWDELNKRFDAYVYAYIQTLTAKQEVSRVCYHGGKFVSLGLTEEIRRKIINDLNKEDKAEEIQ
jgi:hypothetical protein